MTVEEPSKLTIINYVEQTIESIECTQAATFRTIDQSRIPCHEPASKDEMLACQPSPKEDNTLKAATAGVSNTFIGQNTTFQVQSIILLIKHVLLTAATAAVY
jgi:hypothetical protein